jgi:hypothetical protein
MSRHVRVSGLFFIRKQAFGRIAARLTAPVVTEGSEECSTSVLNRLSWFNAVEFN